MASSEDEQVPLTQHLETTPPRWEGLTIEEEIVIPISWKLNQAFIL